MFLVEPENGVYSTQQKESIDLLPTSLQKQISPRDKIVKILLAVLSFLLIVTFATAALILIKSKYKPTPPSSAPTPTPSLISEKIGFEKFKSEEEFATYLQAGAGAVVDFFGAVPKVMVERGLDVLQVPAEEVGKAAVERISETTVQVRGIDEPDIVKTDGSEIYFSSNLGYYRPLVRELPAMEEKVMPPPQGETKIIKAFPPADLSQKAQIGKTGNLLLEKNILVVFSDENRIYGYDVSNPESPTEKWKIEFGQNSSLVDARLYQGKIYFVSRTTVDTIKPCPIVPLSLGENQFSISCTDIYHPIVNVPVNITYTAFILEPDTGKINRSVSFVGSSGQSVIFMSKNALYTTYTYYEDMIEFFYKFFLEEGDDLVSSSIIERLNALRGYDISPQAKMVEFQQVFEQYLSSLSNGERLRIENEFSNRVEDYSQEHMRELERTGIVKIGLDSLNVLATGCVPGRPLNQFSLDEYQNYLRIATTIGEGTFGTSESENDVYVLNSKLELVGSIQGLGLGERIYSARFVEDKGYLVTFREIDPFFVLDLSNPNQPTVKGELKIPGYSSYLHPITKDKILGVGKEDSQVKLSLFDVSSADNPTEISQYMLDESWSDILNTHHAFLLDKERVVFFLPGSNGGYVFSYQGNQLSLKKAVADILARRAIYINDYLYIIGDKKLIVLNEVDWEKISQLDF